MASPSPSQIERLSQLVAEYIQRQREAYSARAEELSSDRLRMMAPFFPPETLRQARAVRLRDERVKDPEFYKEARRMGVADLPSFADVQAITFVDVIVSHVRFDSRLMFHELVHVEQYRQLGVAEFARLYVAGFFQWRRIRRHPARSQRARAGRALSSQPGKAFLCR